MQAKHTRDWGVFVSMERKVILLPTYSFIVNTKVAIYCRVSTAHEDQIHSLENQISSLKAMVSRRLDWELVDIYIDIQSGKNTSGRPAFKRLKEDCRNHKVNLIITKSICRFGRNTEETLAVLNKLRILMVDVYFESERINTQDTRQDFLITILQTAAQAESEARSNNIKWGITRGLESGRSKLYNRKCFGYCQDRDGNLMISEEEAETVRKVFDLYLRGYSVVAIIRELQSLEIKSPAGKDRWSKRAIELMLSNEKYVGNVLVGKTFCNEYPNNRRLVNNGERAKYLAEGNHPSIISEELFERVKAQKERRSNIQTDANGVKRKSTHYSMKKAGKGPG